MEVARVRVLGADQKKSRHSGDSIVLGVSRLVENFL